MCTASRLIRLFTACVIALVLAGCDDESNLRYPITPFGQEPPRITGIYHRDEAGNILGISGYPAGVGFAYPNPCGEIVSVNLSAPAETRIEVWFVRALGPTDGDLSGSLPSGAADRTPWGIPLLQKGKFIQAGENVSDFDLEALPNGFYRMYILFAGELYFDDILKSSDENYAGW